MWHSMCNVLQNTKKLTIIAIGMFCFQQFPLSGLFFFSPYSSESTFLRNQQSLVACRVDWDSGCIKRRGKKNSCERTSGLFWTPSCQTWKKNELSPHIFVAHPLFLLFALIKSSVLMMFGFMWMPYYSTYLDVSGWVEVHVKSVVSG